MVCTNVGSVLLYWHFILLAYRYTVEQHSMVHLSMVLLLYGVK